MSHHTIGASVALDHLPGWGARLLKRVICFDVECLGPLWTGSFVENPTLIRQAYPMLE
jgi:hypothetical protein